MARPIYTRNISDSDRKQLEILQRSDNKGLARRANIILLSAAGESIPAIAKKVGLHYQNVRKWIHRFIESGVPGLEHRGKGKSRNVKHPPEVRQRIAAVAATHPRDLGCPFDTWSLPKLRKYLMEKKIVSRISVETIRQILMANNIDWKSGEYWMHIGGKGQTSNGSVMVSLGDAGFRGGGVTISFDSHGYVAVTDGPPRPSEKVQLVSEQNLKGVNELHAVFVPGSRELRIRLYRKR